MQKPHGSITAKSLVFNRAPLAQLDRASGYEPEGREFESLRARHSFYVLVGFSRTNPATGVTLASPLAQLIDSALRRKPEGRDFPAATSHRAHRLDPFSYGLNAKDTGDIIS